MGMGATGEAMQVGIELIITGLGTARFTENKKILYSGVIQAII